MNLLSCFCEPYAYWTKATDPKTGCEMPGLGNHKFFRFPKRVELHRVELVLECNAGVEGAVANGTPDRVVIEGYTGAEPQGETLFDGSLSWQGSRAEVALGGHTVLAVSIRCSWAHHDRSIHSEHDVTQASWTVPSNAFKNVSWFGREAQDAEPLPDVPAEPPLTKRRINPRAGKGQKAWEDGMFVHYESDWLKVSFSTVRPRMSFLGWDAEGSGLAGKNLLLEHKMDRGPVWSSGPWAYDLAGPRPPYIWGGEVEVNGQEVCYRNLHCGDELVLDVTFLVEAAGFTMAVQQTSSREHAWLEQAAWRFIWDNSSNGSISHFAMPCRGEYRNGRIENRGGIHATGHGVLGFTAETGDTDVGILSAAFDERVLPFTETSVQVGYRAQPFGPLTSLPGETTSSLRFRVTNVEPRLAPGVQRTDVHRGLRKFWATVFGFRAEGGGFSNNALSDNCMNCMYIPADMAAYTQPTEGLPEMLDLLEYTLGLALRGGPGRYMNRWDQDYCHDTPPSLVISAGRIQQCRPRGPWLQDQWPLVQGPLKQILKKLDDQGRYICHARTGNRGDDAWGCTAWDAIAMGHHVAYASVQAYRALWHGVRMSRAMNEVKLAAECESAAEKLKNATVDDLYNPTTGWLADWRSADGELHDHACLFSNSMAACFGMLNDDQARDILGKLEAERLKCGHTDFRYGVATQLWPIRKDEHINWPAGGLFREKGQPNRDDGADMFGMFINGCLAPVFSQYYLQAMSRYGFTETADQICDQLLESFDRHQFEGFLTGNEFFTWDGMVTGYEGTMVHGYGVLYAIGVHKGWVAPLDPEW